MKNKFKKYFNEQDSKIRFINEETLYQEDSDRYIYHLGSPNYERIHSLANLMELGYLKKNKLEYKSQETISAFIGIMNKQNIVDFSKAGFKRYSDLGELWIYRIDLFDVVKSIESVSLFSSDTETEYQNDIWIPLKKRFNEKYTDNSDKKLSKRELAVKSAEFNKLLDTYRVEINRLIGKHEQITSPATYETFIQEIERGRYSRYKEMSKYIEMNLLGGDKDQYASLIPHIQIKPTINGLSINSVCRIK